MTSGWQLPGYITCSYRNSKTPIFKAGCSLFGLSAPLWHRLAGYFWRAEGGHFFPSAEESNIATDLECFLRPEMLRNGAVLEYVFDDYTRLARKRVPVFS